MTERYVLSRRARQDLAGIANSIAERHGPTHAAHVIEQPREAFQFLAEHPGAGHVRSDLTDDPAVRFWVVVGDLVAFAPEERPVGIVSIINGARDPDTITRRLRRAQEE